MGLLRVLVFPQRLRPPLHLHSRVGGKQRRGLESRDAGANVRRRNGNAPGPKSRIQGRVGGPRGRPPQMDPQAQREAASSGVRGQGRGSEEWG